MKSFRNTLAIALTAVTIGLGVISTSDTASAFMPGRHFSHHSSHHFGHCANLCRRPGHHLTNRWGHYHQHWGNHFRFHWHYHYHYRWQHRWGYRWNGYRHVVHGAPVTHAVPVVAGVCPPGTHLGYEHKFCWPNRH